ncbi:MAG TPA: hypothetical protein VN577_05995 [Terriglobales bacterium]|nr:hypothetical protein [Terriglobales bacterium]
MPEAVMEKVSEHLTDSAHKVSRAASRLAEAMDDGIAVAKRAAKHGGDAIEDFMEENTQRVKRHPIETVIGAATAAFLTGMLFGLLIRRKR